MAENVFCRSGFASMSDLRSSGYQRLFQQLEREQVDFLQHEAGFRSGFYPWPRDPLHCWSRVWEYPYVHYHLAAEAARNRAHRKLIAADVGSGVTFFPFSLATLGYDVVCTDVDPVCGVEINKATPLVCSGPGSVQFRLADDHRLPFDDGECDVAYSISVIEHIADLAGAVQEMARVLRPGGLCVITCDVGLEEARGVHLCVSEYERLMAELGTGFRVRWPHCSVHPVDLLTSRTSEGRVHRYCRLAWALAKQRVIKPLLGRPSGSVTLRGIPSLTVLGLVLTREA